MTNSDIESKCRDFSKSIGEHCSAVLVIVSIPGDCACEAGIFSTGAGSMTERMSLAEDYIKWDMAERVAYCMMKNELEEDIEGE
jgi:hypothetical protein